MSTLTIPNSFAPSTTMLSALMNANYTACVTWANGNIDHGNLGSAGIFASQLRPTNGTNATFGGTQPYLFSFAGTGITPVKVSAPSGQTQDIFQVNLNAVKKLSVNSTGQLVFAVAPTGVTFTPLPGAIGSTATSLTATKTAFSGDAGATAGMLLNVHSGSTNGFQFKVAGSNVATISNAGVTSFAAGTFTGAGSFGGAVKSAPTINGHTVSTWVPPLFTSVAGATAANTAHKEFGSVASISSGASATVTLSANAAFTSSSSYIVIVTPSPGRNPSKSGLPVVSITSGTSFIISLNVAPVDHQAVSWMAVGT